jgi:hypothetical protein
MSNLVFIPVKGHNENGLESKKKRKLEETSNKSSQKQVLPNHPPLLPTNEVMMPIPPLPPDVEKYPRKSLKVIISINTHGAVIENQKSKQNKITVDEKKFPNNFITVFWKNKGVCGKLLHTFKNTYKNKEKIHKKYVDLIKREYKDNVINRHFLNGIEPLKEKENRIFPNVFKTNPFFNENQEFFYESCDGYYKHKPETNKLVDKNCYGALSYVNKSLSFVKDEKIFITIINDGDAAKPIFSEVNITDYLSDIIKQISLSSLLQPDTFMEEATKISEEAKKNKKITFDNLFSIFGFLKKYDIYLFLFDYSCSVFPSKISYEDYEEIMKSRSAKGGNNYQTIRRKMKTKKSTIRRKRNTKKRQMM